MLIRFNVKNFLSFSKNESGQSEEFSMLAGKVRNKKEHVYDNNKIKLLKFAAVYGANAAGKSNLVKALNFMKYTILKKLPKGHTEMYCKIDKENKEKESYFELEIMIGKKYYAYGFEVILSQSRFVSEWLVELTSDNNEKIIFTRDIVNGKYEFGTILKEKGLIDKLNVYAEDIEDDGSILLLSAMNENKKNLYKQYSNAKILREVYIWIAKDLDINFPNRPISNYSYMENKEKMDEVCQIIKAFGTGITGAQMVDVAPEKVLADMPRQVSNKILHDIENKMSAMNNNKNLKEVGFIMRSEKDFFVLNIDRNGEVKCQTLNFTHGKENVLFSMSEESDGTIRMLDLLEILIAGENKTYVIDELDRCLHPSLTYKFVETYLQIAAQKNIQLIVTTHESRLLDFDLLRRDEIWFINKRTTGESDIYSLEEYNTRFDQKIDKAYLDGRYGGVPIFSTVFPVKGEN